MATVLSPRELAFYSGDLFNKGYLHEAWKAYSYREVVYWGDTGRILPMPRWTGQPLKGKRLVLTYEQALGEQIMFASMVPDLLEAGAELTIEVDARLVALFQRSFPTCTIVPWQSPWHPEVYKGDYYCLSGNPGLRIRDHTKKFPTTKAHLKAEKSKYTEKCVGISWYSPALRFGKSKSIQFSDFEPLLNSDKFKCLNLQYSIPAPEGSNIVTLEGLDLTNDMDGVAREISGCEKVVTISNTVAHLAGALGVPTYLLISPDHHWYLDLPFYPSVKRVINSDPSRWKELISHFTK